MLNKNVYNVAECLGKRNSKREFLKAIQIKNKNLVHAYVQRALTTNQTSLKHLHLNSKSSTCFPARKLSAILKNIQYKFSTQQQPKIDYNNLNVIRDLQNINSNANKIHLSHNKNQFLSNQYQTISLEFDKKLQRVEAILHSQQKNPFKIVEEILIVLEAFAQTRRREVIEENVVKVVRQFNKKIISAYLQNLQSKQFQENERRKVEKKLNQSENVNIEQIDSNYLLHENYSAPSPDLGYPDNNLSANNDIIDINFIFYYVETIKIWFLNRIQTDSIIRDVEEQMFNLISAREVSVLQQTLKEHLDYLIQNYIDEPSPKKREIFPFDIKIRSLCLLPFFENKQHVEKYLKRLADQNLFIYLKESQIVRILYDVTEIKPNLSQLDNFVYQIQSTKIYQGLSSLNSAYIKALFINYTRKFMVNYQEIQFYELFRDIQSQIKYPSIRTFIRLIEILKTQADDLHCEYNKVMNKYNFNIIISIILSQSYTVQNTKFDELMQLFEALNSLQKAGQILYEQLSRYLKHYVEKQNCALNASQLQKIFRLFLHVIEQAKPLYKYEQKQGMNKQFGKKSTLFLNTLFDILLEKYPEVVVIGHKYIKPYLLSSDRSSSSSICSLPFDDREVSIDLQNSALFESKLQKVKFAFNNILNNKLLSKNLLDTILLFLKTNVHLIKSQGDTLQGVNFLKYPQNFKLLQYLYPTQHGKNFEESFATNVLVPFLKETTSEITKILNSKKSANQLTKNTRNMQKILQCINNMSLSLEYLTQINSFLIETKKNLISVMKVRLQEKQKEQERIRFNDIETLEMATPKGNIELLLCLYEISKLAQKTHQNFPFTKQLPLIYDFINRIAIKNMKSLEEADLIPMLMFLQQLEGAKTAQKDIVLLIEIKTSVYEYIYSAMSVFIMFLGDRGKYYLKLSNHNAENFLSIIHQFVNNKSKFKELESKKRLVILQVILFGLIKKKHLKVTSAHLKRSEHAKILLTFLQIFEYPENINKDLKKLIQDVQFLPNDLQEFSNNILERYSDLNWSIARYLEDNKVGLASSKKLGKLTIQELRKQFEEGKSAKIYEMILKNTKFELPFELPEPRVDDKNVKLAYIIEKIYRKISKKNNYGVPKTVSKSYNTSSKSSKKSKKAKQEISQANFISEFEQNNLNQFEKKLDDVFPNDGSENYNAQEQGNYKLGQYQEINLEAEKSYIKRQSLVNYTYEDHYKMNDNKLPLHFKKQTWKNISSIGRDLEIQTLEIDQQVGQNIYKQVLLALLGYVEKVKMVAQDFHSSSFIQYAAAKLDMEVYFHGCIAKISRKNKPEESVLFVSAVESNYKILYICTHILRESGENAFIISEKTKDHEFKDFLQKLLPQPFEAEESQIVDKVVKGEIGVDGQDNSSEQI